MTALIITGTDTSVGKTVVSAMLTLGLGGVYWKPIQSGTENGTDRQHVEAMTGLSQAHFRPERYVLSQPLSPHRAAELDGIEIDPERLALPGDIPRRQHLIIEGAGGVLVPVTRRLLQADLFARWNATAVLVARTTLGTINHTLLSLEALKRRRVRILGVIFVGETMPDTERTISEMGEIKNLGRLPILPALDAQTLKRAFAIHFDRKDLEITDG